MQLYEKHRPKTWGDVLGQDRVLEKIGLLKKRGLAGRAYFLSGSSGIGKTSIAWLLAREIAGDDFILDIDSSDLTLSALNQIERILHLYGACGDKTGRAVIINEVHGLRRDVVRQFLVVLERLPSHVMVIFTTTTENFTLFEDSNDASPLLSRCIELKLTNQGLCKVFAERAKQIAESEGLDGAPISQYENLVKKHRNNFRAVLQAVDAGEMQK